MSRRFMTVFWIKFLKYLVTLYLLIPLIDSYHLPLEFIYSLETPKILVNNICPEFFNCNSCKFLEIISFLENIDTMSNLKNVELVNAVFKFLS